MASTEARDAERRSGEGSPPGRLGRLRERFKALPHGGSPEGDRAEAVLVLKAGAALAALGGLLFLAGWGRRSGPGSWLLDVAFVLVLLGWVLLLVGGAFRLILFLARFVPPRH